MKTSKLTKDKPKATVVYPDDVKGPVTIKVTGGDEPFTKKINFKGGDDGDDDGPPPPDEGGDIQVDLTQDPNQPRKVTLTLKKAPSDGPSGEGQPSNGKPGSEGGTQGTGSSTADHTAPRDGENGGDGGAALTIDWGGKVGDKAPAELTKDKPATAVYDKSVRKATITVDDDDPGTEPWTKGVKFGDPEPPDGDIAVDAKQDEQNPRKVTFTLTKAPGQDGDQDSGDQDSGEQQA